MFSVFRQLTAAGVACVCAAHPLLPDAFVLHMHDDHHVHAHSIDLDGSARPGAVPTGGHHEGEPPAISGASPDGILITLAKEGWLAIHGRARGQILSAPAASPCVCATAGGMDVAILLDGAPGRSPPAPPPRARCSLHAILLTSRALLI